MEILKTKAAMRAWSAEQKTTIGFVPTMGYLHAGHLSLVERARIDNAKTVVSIFVNPAQFNDPKDFEKYPIDLERDSELLEKAGADALFMPSRAEVYPSGVPALRLSYDAIMARLCGKFRPGHFEGMLLIVHNLLMWVNPTHAYFGLKDYQQFVLVKNMARDLEFPTIVVGCPLLRDADGLALSSRNVRLSTAGRAEALTISRALKKVQAEFPRRKHNLAELKAALVLNLQPLKIEYAEICDADDLSEAVGSAELNKLYIAAVAAFVDGVRLIDNVLLN